MFFFLSKAVSFLVSPLTWALLLLLSALLTRRAARRKRLFACAAAILFLFTNPAIRYGAFRIWEVDPVPYEAIKEPFDIAIVMGGALRTVDPVTGRVVFGNGADRLLQAMTLYRDGRAGKILLTGGSGFVWRQDIRESPLLKEVLLKFNVPAEDIIVEGTSRNTYENARNSAKLIHAHYPDGKYLLITSAYHMRRSMACFHKAGIQVTPFSVDPHAAASGWAPANLVLPDAAHLGAWDMLFHEWAGCVAYRLAGYL